MIKFSEHIMVDPEILGGQPVFKGTRVPVESLFDHLSTGVPLRQFIDEFPTVSLQQAIAVINLTGKLLLQELGRNYI